VGESLISRFRDLKERAEAHSRDVRAQEEYARYERSVELFETARDELASASELARAATEAGISNLPLDEDREWARQVAEELRSTLQAAEGAEIEHLANTAKAAVSVLDTRSVGRFETDLERWADRQPAPSDHVLRILESVARPAVDRTRRSLTLFQNLLESVPTSAAGVRELATAATELRDAYQEVASAAPERVRDFLESAPRGVSLSAVDQTVLKWLWDNEATSSFEVRLRR